MEYEQGSSITLYATFIKDSGEEASISGTPTTTISHYWGGINYDVTAQNMALLSGTTYYYNWNIPARADQTTYTAKYNAVYSGTNLEIANIVGSEDFLVIKRKFYDKKGGGLVQKVSRASIWTMKEKEEVLRILEALAEKDDKRLFDSLEGSIKQLSEKSDLTETKKLIGGLREKISAYEAMIKKLGEKKINFDDSNIVKGLKNLSQTVNSFDRDLRNERITHIVAELEDLHKNFDSFQKVFAKTLPMEIVEEIKNEHGRNNSDRIPEEG